MSSKAPENLQSAALRRSEAYLAETQRLTGTGSFAIAVESRAVTYSSAEHSRLYGFDPGGSVEIVGTIVDVTERRAAEAQPVRVAGEQAALRRVATLVAAGAPQADVFGRVVEEAARVLGDVDVSLWREEGDGTATAVAAFGG